MKRRQRAGYLIAACIVALVGMSQSAQAIPAFARKYNTTCSRCHIGFPKLNTFGKNFKLHGYQQPGDAQTNKLVSDDDPNLSLIETLPLAILIKSSLDFPEWIGAEGRNSFSFLEEVELFYGDTLAPDIGFFGHISFEDGEASIGKNNVVFSHLGNQNVFLQFGLLDLMENGVNPHYSLTSAPYSIFGTDVGGFALHNLVAGVRLYGTVGSSITPALVRGENEPGSGVVSGFTPVFGEEAGQDLVLEDEGSPYDILRGIVWEFGVSDGSAGGHGHGEEPEEHGEGEEAPTVSSPGINDYWGRLGFAFDENSRLGFFGYKGKTIFTHHEEEGGGEPEVFGNDFSLYGADLTWEFGTPFDKAGVMQKPYILQASYVIGNATNPHGEEDAESARLTGYFVELSYLMGDKGILTGRFDQVHSSDISMFNRESFTINYSYYMRTNFVIAGEFTKSISGMGHDSLGLFLKFAF